jgi:uncharacterized delta-60 repeat protein
MIHSLTTSAHQRTLGKAILGCAATLGALLVQATTASAAGPGTCLNTGFQAVATGEGKVIIVGDLGTNLLYSDPTEPDLIVATVMSAVATRVNPDGTVDTSYGAQGTATLSPEPEISPFERIIDAAPTSDGGVVALVFREFDSNLLVKLNASGALDPTFGANGLAATDIGATPGFVGGMRFDHLGRIVVFGSRGDTGVIRRFTANGQLDNSFARGTLKIPASRGPVVDLIADARGVTALENNFVTNKVGISRFSETGASVKAFGSKGRVSVTWPKHAKLFGSSLVVLGSGEAIAQVVDIESAERGLVGYTAKGRLNTKFGNSGRLDVGASASTFGSDALTATAAGTMLIADVVLSGDNLVSRVRSLTLDGRVNTGYGAGGTATLDSNFAARQITPLADGSVLIAGIVADESQADIGIFATWDGAVHRVDAQGNISGLDGDGRIAVDTGASCAAPTVTPLTSAAN